MTAPAGTGRLRVAINARILPGGGAGGVEQHLLGLIEALGRLDDTTTEYLIVVHPLARRWLRGHLGPTQRVVAAPYPWRDRLARLQDGVSRRAGALGLGRLLAPRPRRRGPAAPGPAGPPAADGFLEGLGVDVVHFAYQSVVRTEVPSIFNPVDLQHVHHPEFFPSALAAKREAAYAMGCRQARAVAIASRCGKRDVLERYGLPPDRVYVIPWAAATDLYAPVTGDDLERVRRAHGLPPRFAFYPAQTWPHKNHVRLLEALARLRDETGLGVALVCTGGQNEFWPAVRDRCAALGLDGQVRFLGYVPPGDVRALYRLAEFVVIPSLFEGWGFPLFEAFREGAPVATSSAAALGEYADDAALLFDPTSVEAIAEAVRRLATDRALRDRLRERGRRQVGRFSWARTARAYRALYRHVARRPLTDEDRELLAGAVALDEGRGAGAP